jgi:hypothetical protein
MAPSVAAATSAARKSRRGGAGSGGAGEAVNLFGGPRARTADDGDDANDDGDSDVRTTPTRETHVHLPDGAGADTPARQLTPGFFRRTSTQSAIQLERNKTMFKMKHGAEMAQQLQHQTSMISHQLGTHNRFKKLVLHPEKTKWLGKWDLVTSTALIWTATVTPFESAFISPVLGPAAWEDPWFRINRVLDVVFSIDLMLQFFIAYQAGNDFAGHTWVTSHHKIVRHYVTSWFWLDALTVVLPCTFDIILASEEVSSTVNGTQVAKSGGLANNLGLLRVLRALRLIKLVRLVRASRLFQRWKSMITLEYSTQTILTCVLSTLISAHWSAPTARRTSHATS